MIKVLILEDEDAASTRLKKMIMAKRIKKRYDIEVSAANAIHTKTFELDKTVTKVHGIITNRLKLL